MSQYITWKSLSPVHKVGLFTFQAVVLSIQSFIVIKTDRYMEHINQQEKKRSMELFIGNKDE